MIQIDSRIGSAEFAKLIATMKLPVEVTTLAFGDMAFLGRGPGEMPIPVGIERKALSDFVTSYRGGRIWDQLEGMTKCYQDRWIILEGLFRKDHKSGLVVVPKGKGWYPVDVGGQTLTHQELETMILSAQLKGGCRLVKTNDKQQTAYWIRYLYRWWVDTGWDGHHGHLEFRELEPDAGLLIKPSLLRTWAAMLPGIGWAKSMVADQFGSVLEMVTATEDQWSEKQWLDKTLKPRKIGSIVAAKVVAAIGTGKLP